MEEENENESHSTEIQPSTNGITDSIRKEEESNTSHDNQKDDQPETISSLLNKSLIDDKQMKILQAYQLDDSEDLEDDDYEVELEVEDEL